MEGLVDPRTDSLTCRAWSMETFPLAKLATIHRQLLSTYVAPAHVWVEMGLPLVLRIVLVCYNTSTLLVSSLVCWVRLNKGIEGRGHVEKTQQSA
jgi:hypothetical protein